MNVGDLSNISLQKLIDSISKQDLAETRRNSDLRPRVALRLNITLDNATSRQNPYIINNPFNGFYVESTTSPSVNVGMSIGSLDEYNTSNPMIITSNVSAKFDTVMRGAALFWSAQPGKVLTMVFFLGVDYRPGSFITTLSGSVTVNSGTQLVTGTLGAGISSTVNIAANTLGQLMPINSLRNSCTFYTNADIWVGDTNANINIGVLIKAGSTFKIANTAAAYAFAVTAAVISGIEES